MASPAAVLSVLVKADGIAKTNAQLQGLHGDLGKSSKAAGRLGADLDKSTRTGSKALAGLKSAAGLAGIAIGAAGLAGAVKDSIAEYREAQKVGAQTNAVIKSTGGAANVSAKHVGELANAISRKAGIDDEAIQSGSNLLLTFKGVRNEVGKGNDIFDQATQTITDMSVSLKQGLKPSAIQLGKALNDPIKGITALGRVGVQFTEGQKKMIAGLVKSGDTLGAQKVILKELKSEFGGSAAAAATAGDKLGVSFKNLEEAAGAVLVPAIDKVAKVLAVLFDGMVQNEGIGGAMVSTFKSVGSVFLDVVGATTGVVKAFKDGNAGAILLVTTVGTLTAAYVGYRTVVIASTIVTTAMTAATAALTFATGALAAPILAVIAVLAVLTAAVIYAYKHNETFRKIINALWATLKTVTAWLVSVGVAAFKVFAGVVKAAWGAVQTATTTVWGGIKAYLGGEWAAIKGIATTVWSGIKAVILDPIRAVRDALGGKDGIWAKIHDGAVGAWNTIKSSVGDFAVGVKNAVVDAFQGAVNAVIDFVNLIIKVVNLIPGVPKIKPIGHIGGGGGGKPAPQKNLGGSGHLAKGGMVPGSGYGDKVPLHIAGRLAAMVEPGEMVSVANRNATAALMSVNGAVPRYASGGLLEGIGNLVEPGMSAITGGADAASYIRKLPGTGGLGWISGLGKYALGKVKNWITGQMEGGGGSSGGPVPAGTVRDWLTKALKITDHFNTGNLAALFGRAIQESGGRPHAINLWDINAKQGHPSKGLLQTIDSTFNAYKLPGHGNIWDPIDNAIAAIRYMFAAYGHIVGPSSTGYAEGGVIPFANGGVIPAFKKGGKVAKHAKKAKKAAAPVAKASAVSKGTSGGWAGQTRDLMAKVWAVAAPFFGGGEMPKTRFTTGLDSLFVGADDTGTVFWPKWASTGKHGLLAGDNEMQNLLLHEWTHTRQRKNLKLWESEGGATAYARLIAPHVFSALKLPFSTPTLIGDPYLDFFRQVRSKHDKKWITQGQFAHSPLPFLGSYHSGGVAPREGLAHVSAGERMTPAGNGGPLVNIEHAEFKSGVDVNSFAARIGFKIATA